MHSSPPQHAEPSELLSLGVERDESITLGDEDERIIWRSDTGHHSGVIKSFSTPCSEMEINSGAQKCFYNMDHYTIS